MKTPVPGASIGISDLDVLALTLHHEASGDGVRGMTAVGCVIRNRTAWGKWGLTMRDVCLAHKQFSCWRPAGGTTNYGRLVMHADAIRAGRRPPVMAPAYAVAEAITHGLSADLTGGADHYWAPLSMRPVGREPAWARGVTARRVVDLHVFIRLRPGSSEVSRA